MSRKVITLNWKVVALPIRRSINSSDKLVVRSAVEALQIDQTQFVFKNGSLCGSNSEAVINVIFNGTAAVADSVTKALQGIGLWYYSAYEAGILTTTGHKNDWFSYSQR